MSGCPKKNVVIIISGPTASGKTSTSLVLAKELINFFDQKVSIVNFDSLNFYRELNVGTAKPTKDEQILAPHKLIDISSAKNPMNASDYIKLANQTIDSLHHQNQIVLLVGGSAFYLRALLKGMYEGESTSCEIKKRIEDLFNKEGIAPFLDILRVNDPKSLENLHPNDHYRIMRAVEYFWTTGNPISNQKAKLDASNPYDFKENIHPSWNIFHLHLDLPKDEHLKIIEKRTFAMIEDGLIQEVQNLIDAGFTGMEKPLQSIGYKETLEYLKGEFKNQKDYIERIIISTRQLAKAQRTFFKKITNINQFNPINEQQKIINEIINWLRS